jgi:hypothetical protein
MPYLDSAGSCPRPAAPGPTRKTGDPAAGPVTYPTRPARAVGAGAREGFRYECAGHR